MFQLGGRILAVTALSAFVACNKKPSPQPQVEAPTEVAKKGASVDPKAKSDVQERMSQLPPLPKEFMAKVDGKTIPMSTFNEIYGLKRAKYLTRKRGLPKTADRRYRKSISERILYQELLNKEAEKEKLAYDAAALSEREERQKQGMKDWPKHLARRGESDSSLRAIYIAELLEKEILTHRKGIELTDAEVDAEYDRIKENYRSKSDRVHAAHILASTRPDPDAPEDASEAAKNTRVQAAKTRAEHIYELASVEGAQFSELAKLHSDGPSKYKGGDLGIFSADRMVKEFSTAAFALKPGQISKPVETQFGFHVIKVLERFKPGLLPKTALEEQIRTRLIARKLLDGKRALKKELFANAEIENFVVASLGDPPIPKAPPELQEGAPSPQPSVHGASRGHGEVETPAHVE